VWLEAAILFAPKLLPIKAVFVVEVLAV
jgi:hypothetical protein